MCNEFPHHDFAEHVRQALKDWHKESAASRSIEYLYLVRQKLREGAASTRQAINEVVLETLKKLEIENDQHARVLHLRFLNQKTVYATANELNLAEATVFELQRNAIRHLANLLWDMESAALEQHQSRLEARLDPATSVNLIGVDAHVEQLMAKLTTCDAPWVISIEGIGGIGKTSLADALMRQAIAQNAFDNIGWVSARQTHLDLSGGIKTVGEPGLTAEMLVEMLMTQLMPEQPLPTESSSERARQILQTELQQRPHLIVIDNLETVADVDSLWPTLQHLANPTKFLLTSRDSLYSEPNLYHFPVPELSDAAAIALVRQEANLSNLPILAESPDDELRPIIETVGGNPLALRLVVGQMHIHPRDAILADLKGARGEPVENLYTFIYRRAWDSLDERSQRVLLAMPFVHPRGDDLEHLQAVSRLAIDELRVALSNLVTRNLVDSRGDLYQRRYNIHSLTRTFLQEQVARWHE